MKLTDETFLLYAARNYDNPNCQTLAEFESDLGILLHIKRLFKRYEKDQELRSALISNHIICFLNVFKPIACYHLLFFKLPSSYHSYLKTFLVHLKRIDEKTYIHGININEIPLCVDIVERLKRPNADSDQDS